jgi:hypothetical protein
VAEPENGTRRSADLIIAKMEGQLTALVTMITEMRLWLMGDGTPANPGIMIRIDRLEQHRQELEDKERTHSTQRGALGVSVILLFIERLWHWISLYVAAK